MMQEVDPTPQAHWDNTEWAREHATELYEQYEGKWIAIADRRVVAIGNHPISVRQLAARKTGHTMAEVYVKFCESAAAIYGTNWTLV